MATTMTNSATLVIIILVVVGLLLTTAPTGFAKEWPLFP